MVHVHWLSGTVNESFNDLVHYMYGTPPPGTPLRSSQVYVKCVELDSFDFLLDIQ